MKIQEARELGDRLARLVSLRRYAEAGDLLNPVLLERTPFRLLDAIGERLEDEPSDAVHDFLDRVATQRTMGGWVVIASALRQQSARDLAGTFEHCSSYVIAADVWYATDIFGERLPGPALTAQFEPALALLAPWRQDPNRWMRRIVGVAVHFWAKRSRGAAASLPQARELLDFMAPVFTESDTDAIKGVGWGLKTLGKYYPDLVADWLAQQAGRPHRALLLRKATVYLPPEFRQRVIQMMP
jgi:hypothetical protein